MSQAFPPLGPEYEPFLYAVVCDEANGAPLTMVSAIARSGADPWQEAARIARLPKSAAFEALVRLIPNRGDDETKAIAKRLLALLPATRESMNFRLAGSSKKSAALNPLLLIVVALILSATVVSVFRRTHQSAAGSHDPPTAAPIADKADP